MKTWKKYLMDYYFGQIWREKGKKDKKLTLEKLSVLMGCSRAQAGKITNEKNGKWIREWGPKFADAMGVKGWQLFFKKDQLAQDPEIRAAVLGTEINAIKEVWDQIPEGDRGTAFQVMVGALKPFIDKKDRVGETQGI